MREQPYAPPDAVAHCDYCGVRVPGDEKWCPDCAPNICECGEECDPGEETCPACIEARDDEDGNCRQCHGSGVGTAGRGKCDRCHGTGLARPSTDHDDYDGPDEPVDYDGPMPECGEGP